MIYAFDRAPAVAKAKPELAKTEPFKTVLSGDRAAIAKLLNQGHRNDFRRDLHRDERRGVSGGDQQMAEDRPAPALEAALHPQAAYQPMQEVINYLRARGYRTYIVTGSGQDFVRVFAERVYGIPPEQVIGSANATRYGYEAYEKAFLTLEPKLLLDDNFSGKPEDIYLVIGRRPFVVSGNPPGTGRCWNIPRRGATRGLR